jgi:hypothetical protein
MLEIAAKDDMLVTILFFARACWLSYPINPYPLKMYRVGRERDLLHFIQTAQNGCSTLLNSDRFLV